MRSAIFERCEKNAMPSTAPAADRTRTTSPCAAPWDDATSSAKTQGWRVAIRRAPR
jgi:hypothetical protein